jgi:hypothetical protein
MSCFIQLFQKALQGINLGTITVLISMVPDLFEAWLSFFLSLTLEMHTDLHGHIVYLQSHRFSSGDLVMFLGYVTSRK